VATPAAASTASTAASTAADGFGDFGDFGDFGEAAVAPADSGGIDFDFGDGGSTPPADDGFGDFGASQDKSLPPTGGDTTADFGDFGDFGETAPAAGGDAAAAAAAAAAVTPDAFGDFGGDTGVPTSGIGGVGGVVDVGDVPVAAAPEPAAEQEPAAEAEAEPEPELELVPELSVHIEGGSLIGGTSPARCRSDLLRPTRLHFVDSSLPLTLLATGVKSNSAETLAQLRMTMEASLQLPAEWVFVMRGAPVGRKAERKRLVQDLGEAIVVRDKSAPTATPALAPATGAAPVGTPVHTEGGTLLGSKCAVTICCLFRFARSHSLLCLPQSPPCSNVRGGKQVWRDTAAASHEDGSFASAA
jgi:hypothetical protein